jgi:hypothetical protein
MCRGGCNQEQRETTVPQPTLTRVRQILGSGPDKWHSGRVGQRLGVLQRRKSSISSAGKGLYRNDAGGLNSGGSRRRVWGKREGPHGA